MPRVGLVGHILWPLACAGEGLWTGVLSLSQMALSSHCWSLGFEGSAGHRCRAHCSFPLQESCARVLLFRGASKEIRNYNSQTAFQVRQRAPAEPPRARRAQHLAERTPVQGVCSDTGLVAGVGKRTHGTCGKGCGDGILVSAS